MGFLLIFNRLFRGQDCVIICEPSYTIFYFRGDNQMNTRLSAIYLKLNKIDSRYIRLAFIVIAFAASRGIILGVPIHGDVGS
jgi:hypothetical protein